MAKSGIFILYFLLEIKRHAVKRPCKEHTFLTHIDDVRNMEENLLQILGNFNNEKNSAFGIYYNNKAIIMKL